MSRFRILSKLKIMITLLITNHCSMTIGVVSSSKHNAHYSLESITNMGLYEERNNWFGMSRILCASECSLDTHCKSFLWDSMNGNCIIGLHWPVENGQLLPTGTQKLYSRTHNCGYDLGYKLMSNNDMQGFRCVYVSVDMLTYISAQQKCADLGGGRLFKSNTTELIDLVKELANERGLNEDSLIYIGLDDTTKGDTFVWSDGQMMNDQETSSIYSSYLNSSPNPNVTDCGYITMRWSGVNYGVCNNYYYYACEMDY